MAKRRSIADKVKFKSVDELFDVTDPRNADEKTICEIPLYDLYPFQNHPFEVGDDEESTIVMVDSNIQREELLFSEKAFAYKMKLEAIKRTVGRHKKMVLNLSTIWTKKIYRVDIR